MVEIICSNYLLYTLMGVFVFGVLSRLILVAVYNGLKRSTYNMSSSNNKLLKQIKLKYESYDKLEIPVTNTEAFTKRALYEYRVCGMSLRFFEKLLGQALFWCITIGTVAIGCGYFLKLPSDTIMLYAASTVIFSVLLYNIDKVSDVQYTRENIEVCIIDFLENHIRERLPEEEEVDTQEIEYFEDECVIEDIGAIEDEMSDTISAATTKVPEKKAQKVTKKSVNNKRTVEDGNKIIEDVLNEIFC